MGLPWADHAGFLRLCETHVVAVFWDMGDGRGVSCIDVFVPPEAR